MTLVTGTAEDASFSSSSSSSQSRRVVGVLKQDDNAGTIQNEDHDTTISLGNNVHIYKHTMATIPRGISDSDALSTAAASLVGIHCAMPKLERVGGGTADTDVFYYSGKAVILGGNDLACFLAE